MKKRVKAGETADVHSLPTRKRGKPLLLGEKLDKEVKCYIGAVREGGGVINTAFTIAAATAIVRKTDRSLLAENGGPILLTNSLGQICFVQIKFCQKERKLSRKNNHKRFRRCKTSVSS